MNDFLCREMESDGRKTSADALHRPDIDKAKEAACREEAASLMARPDMVPLRLNPMFAKFKSTTGASPESTT